jgi:hypothetical protein
MASLRQRYIAWRARRRVQKALKRSRGTSRREFVYLDEVSVYSLIASRLGAVTSELTDGQTATLTSESGADLEVGLSPAVKAKATAKVQGTKSRSTQVLRKATVQSTFKQLLEVEDRLVVPPPSSGVAPYASKRDLEVGASRGKAEPWVIASQKLGRGELVEALVEVAVDPVYRVSSIIDAMSELLEEYPAMATPEVRAQFEQARIMNRILDKFMVGLVPVKCKMVDYRCVNIDGHDYLVHQQAIDGLPQAERPQTRDVFVVGVTDEQLYWKDLRRILFSDSRFTVLCRINRPGIRTSWRPVKLAEVLEVAMPNLTVQMESLGQGALEAMAGAAAIGAGNQLKYKRKIALSRYADKIVESRGLALSDSARIAVDIAADAGADDFGSIDSRRAAFSAIESCVDSSSLAIDPTSAATWRVECLAEAGLDPNGALLPGPAPAPASPSVGSQRYIDTDLIAMYW